MKLNAYYQLSDDWGWFIYIDEHNNYTQNISYPYKPVKKFNKLKRIQEYEDEYEYYHKNHKDPEENYDINLQSPNTNINNENINYKNIDNKNQINTIFNVGSTTLITSLLAYIIFIIL
jgi:hypothetical protein